MSEEKKRGRPPKPVVKTTRKDLADNAKFWLSLATLRTNPITKKKEVLSQLDMMNIKMINKALSGNVNAYNAIVDRAFGKPKQYSEVDINQRVNIVAVSWADDPAQKITTAIPEPQGESIEFEPVELPDKEVQEFDDETKEAE